MGKNTPWKCNLILATFTAELYHYLSNNDKSGLVHVYHNEVCMGLVQARSGGVKHTTGEIIIFLDSHMEVLDGW